MSKLLGVIPMPRVMSATQKSTNCGFVTTLNSTDSFASDSFTTETITNVHNLIYLFLRKITNGQRFMLSHMFRLADKLKIYYSIIILNTILMTNNLFRKRFKFSTKMLFHYMNMLHDPFTIYVDSYITISSLRGFVPHLSIKAFQALPPAFMNYTADNGLSTNGWSITAFNRAYRVNLASLHRYSLLQTGRVSQW